MRERRTGQRMFERAGTDDRGVPLLRGQWSRPPIWYAAGTLTSSLVMLLVWLGACLPEAISGKPDRVLPGWLVLPYRWSLVVVVGWCAVSLAGHGFWLVRVRKRLRTTIGSDELAVRRGIKADTLRRIVEHHHIQPIYNINGVDYYNRADFADAAILLRPVEQPPQPALLRPAASSQVNAEQWDPLESTCRHASLSIL